MDSFKFLNALNCMYDACEWINNGITNADPSCKLRFEVLQFSKVGETWANVRQITEFYNNNWSGNEDFMHIPGIFTTFYNILNYPIIIAREYDSNEILAIESIKFEENRGNSFAPYYPLTNTDFFKITGVLVKKDAAYKRMGQRLYEIAVRGAYTFNQFFPNTKLMCLIDCRNKSSLCALSKVMNDFGDWGAFGQGKELPASIIGYYELRDTNNSRLKEAPTLVIDINMDPRNREARHQVKHRIELNKDVNFPLYQALCNQLQTEFKPYGIGEPIISNNDELGNVVFYPIYGECNISEIEINPNGTEIGNNRVPKFDEDEIKLFDKLTMNFANRRKGDG